jgi:hypothetical protein
MTRTNRLALLGAATLLVIITGSALANRAPSTDDGPAPLAASPESEAAPSVEDLAHARDRLAASDITVDEAVFNDLATRYGVGGAVRIYAWSTEKTKPIAEITAMRDGDATTAGMGWGQIAKELDVHPGIGSIMGGGKGLAHAPGQQKAPGQDE